MSPTPATKEKVLELQQVGKTIDGTDLLDGMNLSLQAGEQVAVMGRSGVGKTSLLHLACGMDQPDSGKVFVQGQCISAMPEPNRTKWRAKHIGLVFQDFNLIDSLTVQENIELPLWLCGLGNRDEAIRPLSEALGIESLLTRLPIALSGGEKQRVAIARALVHRPRLVLADEPTGSLDEANARVVLDLFSDMTRMLGCAVLLVTHDPSSAKTCDQILELSAGKLQPIQLA